MMTEHNNGRTNCSSASSSDSNGSNTSSRCAIHLPDDLIIKVLSRLPGKALLKFMCVSKSWRNIISNSLPTSPMSGLFLSFSNSKKLALLGSGCSTSNCLEALQSQCASLRISHPKITLIHHCNGLSLLSDDGDFGTSYYVCNPATNQCVALPETPPSSVLSTNHSAILSFDPCKSSHYKVVRIGGDYFYDPSDQVEVQIFSSDKNQWVSFSFSSYFGERPFHCGDLRSLHKRLIYLNGALYFLCFRGLRIISFNVEEKLFREFELPRIGVEANCLGESEGRLYYVTCNSAELQIWMLSSFDTGRWLRKRDLHVVEVGKVVSPASFLSRATVMAFHTNLEVLFIIHTSGVIFSYYFGGPGGMEGIDRLKEVCSIGHDEHVDFVYPYSRCLASLNDVCK